MQFGVLKFVFGSGAFARKKMLFVHLNGENCSGIRRGRVNTKKGAAKVWLCHGRGNAMFGVTCACRVAFPCRKWQALQLRS